MSNVIDLIINGIKWAFDTLEEFEFLGTNMLQFSITILIISAFLPIILTLIGKIEPSRVQRSERVKENDNK